KLGTGARLNVRLPAGRYTLRLVARDARGRRGVAQIGARVPAPRLQLLDIRFAKSVKRGTRSLVVWLRASAPATLRAARRRYRVDAHLRRIVVALPKRPVRGIIRLPVTLTPRAGSTGEVRGTIEVV